MRIVDYGAFAAFDVEVTAADGQTHVVEVSGLIHRNELSWGKHRLVEDVVQVGSTVSSPCIVCWCTACALPCGCACTPVSRTAAVMWRAACSVMHEGRRHTRLAVGANTQTVSARPRC